MRFSGDRAVIFNAARWAALGLACISLASCETTKKSADGRKHGLEYFSETEYGVKASPRVFTGRNVPKGGGRYQVGKPYQVKGQWYKPKEDFGYNKVGLASWYGSAFHGRLTANGEVYDQYHLSAAHPTFPLPSYARVTNMDNGTSVIVRVNDRGPYHPGRIIDLSDKAADMLEMKGHGTAKVRVQYVGKARMDGRDMPYLMASYTKGKGGRAPRFEPQIATGVMVASNETSIGLPDNGTDQSAATALASTKTTKAFDSFGTLEFAALPEFGPIPRERPEMTLDIALTNDNLTSGYAEFRIEQQSAGPFAAILTKSRLDADSIRASWLRKNTTSADRR